MVGVIWVSKGWDMGDFEWSVPVRAIKPQQVGKLRRMHHLGDSVKRWVDEAGWVYEIDYRSGNRVCLCQMSTCPEDSTVTD